MLSEFRLVWDFFGSVISALPNDIVSVVSFVFCGVGVVGLLRSF